MIRQFYLENEYGVRWGLNSPETGLFTKPTGLGYVMNSAYENIGSSFVRSYLKEKQQKISGTLIFGTTVPYKACNAFVNFTNAAEELKMIYVTDVGEYCRNVDLVEFGKTEITQERVLECGIHLQCRGLFFSNQTDRFVISRSEGELRWDFRWPVRFNDYGSRKMIINNTGHTPASFEMEIFGYCENPLIRIVKEKREVHRAYFPVTLQTGERIRYSSVDGNLYCTLVDSEGNEENFSDFLDINNTNFFKFPIGDSEFQFLSDTGTTNRTVLTVYKFYRAV